MTSVSYLLPFSLWMLAVFQETRQIVPEEFVKARPAKATSKAVKKADYRPVNPASGLQDKSSNLVQLGLTVWRLRPSKTIDQGARIIVHEGADSVEWTPERVEADAPLRVGERIRIGIESPNTGYLYVIDREQYADGTFGDPYLVFPTTRTRGGDNRVTAGRLIEIPGQEDHPNFFTLKQSRPDQIAEALIVVVTPQPLPGITIGSQPLVLAREEVTKWEKTWSASAERFELAGGAGKTWTRAEQAAGADGTRLLTQEDPGPQTIYRVAAKQNSPILVKVGLRYRKPQP